MTIDTPLIPHLPYPLMLIVIISFAGLDAITTHLILSMGGYEYNPVMSPFNQNPWLLVLIKTGYIFIIYMMAVWIERRINKGGWVLVIITSVVTSFGIINNIIVLLQHG